MIVTPLSLVCQAVEKQGLSGSLIAAQGGAAIINGQKSLKMEER
jgi:hypothetical protein